MYTFKSPIQKKNIFICNLNEKIILNLNDIKIKKIEKTNSQKNYILTCYINKKINNTEINEIKMIDNEAYNSIINNNEWFEEKIENDEIDKLYISSYNDDNILNIILPIDLIKVKINNYIDNDIQELLKILKDYNNLKKYLIDISISHYGLFFHSNKFINKWIVKEINIENINDDNLILNKEEIENEWESDINKINNNIDNNINELYNIKEKINLLFNEIKYIEKSDNDLWENKLNELKYIIQSSNNRILSIYDNR